jgi:hypothetical protein
VTQTIAGAERARTAPPHRVAHAEDPARPGTALCGCRLSGNPTTAAAERCVVCLDLARRTFVGR